MVPSRWPIRSKFGLGIALVLVIVLTLFTSAYYGLYAYRELVKGLSLRSAEIPLAIELSETVSKLNLILARARTVSEISNEVGRIPLGGSGSLDLQRRREDFRDAFDNFQAVAQRYRQQLDVNRLRNAGRIADDRKERLTLAEIDHVVDRMDARQEGRDWLFTEIAVADLEQDAEQLQSLVNQLPGHLQQKLGSLAYDVRVQYRTAIVIAWSSLLLALMMLGLFFLMFRKWIVFPLRALFEGSRKVADGNYDFRVHLETGDEMGQLAESMNTMTAEFQRIRDDLDAQVRERTKQVVRNEQLASVGFLAAGVAHEINNPLASIAMCSESLEGRLSELFEGCEERPDIRIVRDYLGMIQRESFRCKEITERLLDFSRMGEAQRQHAEIRDLAAGVVDMVRHLGKYHDKQVILEEGRPIIGRVNAQELKQVLLNLITNGLESVEPGGRVHVSLSKVGENVRIEVRDNGCGMTEDVIEHLFEPFFTRRRDGQGTGLGLSITYRIIAEHNGNIVAMSDGPGTGSTFVVEIPLATRITDDHHLTEEDHGAQAA